ncbi:flagellin modification protein A [Campylobacter sp. IFREMER_LSEM_CL2101]|uniref:oxidoreductase n=1 Tax=Campylobacter sp. IFREMER_LSEM_CL2101 TaxID=2911618 RepID=UPI0021E87A23|nr:oxidoreductase [Campylobacter sp. IFREMER_LSEM_CL2101]MCV3391541.1 flagellin modification protein A [Campylobacter sp. IFREMER_LSEM_CL2101]
MLKDKIVVITGGSGLIGSSFVEAVVQNQGIAVIADINLDLAYDLKSQLENKYQNVNIECTLLDITSKDSIQKCIIYLNDKYSRIDALVNNAYPRTKNWGKKSFYEVEYEDFCLNMNMQMGGYLLCSQQFSIYFKNQGFGNIVSISSIQGVYAPKFDTYYGTSMTSPIEYSIVKAGVNHMTRYLAKYFANSGIRVNAIAPGGILDKQPESFLERYREYCTSKGMLDAQDLNGALVFLLSDNSKFINGQILVVDDGWGL